MINCFYEELNYSDASFPVIYHVDLLESSKQSSSFRAHWHDSIEILYFVEGTANVKCDNNTVSANLGDIVIVNTNQLHQIHSTSKKCKYHCLIISPSFFNRNELDLFTKVFVNLVSQDIYITNLFDSIINEFNSKDKNYKLSIRGCIYNVFTYFMRNCINDTTVISNQRKKILDAIKLTLSYMENNYQKPITLDEICSRIYLSKYYLCRIFKEEIGKSPIEYLNLIRISKATELLQSGKYNVTEAAEKCGFSNISYFSKVFKKYKSQPPSKMRPS
jgi:YesN/AraC family two-component response regulator